MKGRHTAGGWSPFWRDILLRSILVLLLIAMAAFIWWLFSEDDLFTEAVPSTSEGVTTATAEAGTTTPASEVDTTTLITAETTSTSTTSAVTTTTTSAPITSTTSTIPPPLAPDELVIKVFNANGVSGVAGRTTALLEEAGYGVESPDNHPQLLDISRVWYRGDLNREAQQIKETLLPDALVEPVPQEQEGIDIMVVLGRSFQE